MTNRANSQLKPRRQQARQITALVSCAIGLLLTAQLAVADSFRCGRKVIRSGDSPATLMRYCGEPAYRGRGYADVDTGDGQRQVKVEQWHYKLGERALEHIVYVYRGKVVGVDVGRR